ncbi:MAG TPA: polysaccharide biosynthesis/export family protein [Stellaceae bacterium]|nr:polysaccharide biosynthesis/export family protein [Stellaceae bacterium]
MSELSLPNRPVRGAAVAKLSWRCAFFPLFAGLALSSCTWLPATGPTAHSLVDQAESQGEPHVVEVNAKVVDELVAHRAPSLRSNFASYGHPPPPLISVGDTVVVSIWEGAAGTLFDGDSGVDASRAAAAHATVLLPQMVPTDGRITIPFAGRVAVEGLTAAQAQEKIRGLLRGKTPEPQVLLSVSASDYYSVTVVGEGIKGARVPLSPRGDRILDILAMVGGAQSPSFDTYIRLTRGELSGMIPLSTLIDSPAENIYVWPGDVLTFLVVPRSFQVLGATGKNAQVNFDQKTLTAAQALAKSQGLVDEKADPAGVFLFREEPAALAASLGVPVGPQGDVAVPVIYHFDLTDPDAYFLAGRFPVENNDLLYAAPARVNALQKFLQLLGIISNPVVNGIVIKNNAP